MWHLKFPSARLVLLTVASCGGSVRTTTVGDAGRADAAVQKAEAGPCAIDTSNYDLSCSTDSDCVGFIAGSEPGLGLGGLPVQSGNYCTPMCFCGGDVISKKSVAQYTTDVSKTPLGSGAIAPLSCGCGDEPGPCCENGQCVAKSVCGPIGGPFDAGAPTTGGALPDGSVMCALEMGAIDSGAQGNGAWRWCTPPERCVTSTAVGLAVPSRARAAFRFALYRRPTVDSEGGAKCGPSFR